MGFVGTMGFNMDFVNRKHNMVTLEREDKLHSFSFNEMFRYCNEFIERISFTGGFDSNSKGPQT